jgi:hypothetical protein
MTSLLSARSESPSVLGAQQPRVLLIPEFDSTSGHEAVALARSAGLEPDPWQEFVTVNALGERDDGQWAAGEVGVEVPRQNGKGGLLEIRELAGLFLFGEMLLIHSAHEFATAEEALERMVGLLEADSELWKRVRTVKRSHGQEGIYLKSGQRLRYRTRTRGGGRGWSADWVGLDEAMHIPEPMHGALMPTLSAMPNPQLWYTGSAVDQETMENGVVFARVRERALRASDSTLAYFGWSPAIEHPDHVTETQASDPEVWAQGNPGLGIRISAEWIQKEQASMAPRTFAVERLGVGDWPALTVDGAVISATTWLSLRDPASKRDGPVWFAFDVPEDRSGAAICAAGRRTDGLFHVEVVEHRPGTDWVVGRLEELERKHQPEAILYDHKAPAASLEKQIENAQVSVKPINSSEHAQACGVLFDAVEQRTVRHLGTAETLTAIKGAVKRPLGDAWAWSRKSSTVDISPLVACTIALWGSVEEVSGNAQNVWVFG